MSTTTNRAAVAVADFQKLNFFITGKIKPYVRMTQSGKWIKKDAGEYLASQEAIAWQLKQQMDGNDMLPASTPIKVRIVLEQPKAIHRFDFDNAIKALCDAAQGIVFKNDLWIDEISAERRIGEDYKAWLTVEILR